MLNGRKMIYFYIRSKLKQFGRMMLVTSNHAFGGQKTWHDVGLMLIIPVTHCCGTIGAIGLSPSIDCAVWITT